VLLRTNPLIDVHDTSEIDVVVRSGRVLDRRDLDQVLWEVEQMAQNGGG
jgi:hypothetical protein